MKPAKRPQKLVMTRSLILGWAWHLVYVRVVCPFTEWPSAGLCDGSLILTFYDLIQLTCDPDAFLHTVVADIFLGD